MSDQSPENLNLQKRGDARMLENAVQRWQLTADQKKYAVLKVMEAIKKCPEKNARTLASLVRTLALLERQNQHDEQRLEPQRNLNVNVTSEQLAQMSDEELDALERRITGRSSSPAA